MRPKADKTKDIESYVLFIRKNLAKAYALWHIAETSKNQKSYEQFLNFVTKVLKAGPEEDAVLLYMNEVMDSTCLIHYIVMALIHLKRIEEAFGTLKLWMKNLIKNKTKHVRDGDWLCLKDEDPKADIIGIIARIDKGSDMANLFICLIPIKLEVISDMKTRLNDRNCLTQAFHEDNQEVIERLEKKYPKTVGVSMRDLNPIMFDGMDKKSYEAELENQINILKYYILQCYEANPEESMHPKFVQDILDFDDKFTNDVINSHLDEKISYQTKESASLRSVWSYFERVFKDKDQDRAKLIQSITKQLSEAQGFEWPTKVRHFPIECNPRTKNPNPANHVFTQ